MHPTRAIAGCRRAVAAGASLPHHAPRPCTPSRTARPAACRQAAGAWQTRPTRAGAPRAALRAQAGGSRARPRPPGGIGRWPPHRAHQQRTQRGLTSGWLEGGGHLPDCLAGCEASVISWTCIRASKYARFPAATAHQKPCQAATTKGQRHSGRRAVASRQEGSLHWPAPPVGRCTLGSLLRWRQCPHLRP